MKVLLLNQFFHPDVSATAQLATDLAEDLVRAGFEVTALATRGAYLGGGKLAGSDEYHGIRIERVRCTSLGKGSIARRIADYATFYAAAATRVLAGRRHDAVIVMSTPPLVATLGAVRRVVRGTPFVYWLQDVYPELAIEFGLFGERSVAARTFDAASRWTMKRADAVVVLGQSMRRRVEAKGVDPKRIHVVPNWADGGAVRPIDSETNAFRREHGLDGKRVVLYSGNMGRGHDLQTLVEAARLLRDRHDIVFLFVGDGAKRSEIEAASRELPSLRLLPYQPRGQLAASLSAGEVHLVTQSSFTDGLLEPSKLYGAMAAGRPVVYVGPLGTEAAHTIERERIGSVVPNGAAAAAARAIESALRDAATLGTRARSCFEEAYDRPHRTTMFAEMLRRLEASRASGK